MSTNDYARVAVGMAWLAEHLPTLDGLNITAVSVTPHGVSVQLNSHDEARTFTADLAEATGYRFDQWEGQPATHVTFQAEDVIEVTPGEKPWERMSVAVSAYEKEPVR